MNALSNESFSHKGEPKGLYTLEPSRSDWDTEMGGKVAKAHERKFHECVIK